VLLDMEIDIKCLQSEVANLPAKLWNSSANRVSTQRHVNSIFLRGYAPAEGDKPIHDREILKYLPYCREILESKFYATPQRCLLARLASRQAIKPHIDHGQYFSNNVRVHIPIVSNSSTWMMCAGLFYTMQEGEAWALNNSALHAVWNGHPTQSRTHLICDFSLTSELHSLLLSGKRHMGKANPEVELAIRRARTP